MREFASAKIIFFSKMLGKLSLGRHFIRSIIEMEHRTGSTVNKHIRLRLA